MIQIFRIIANVCINRHHELDVAGVFDDELSGQIIECIRFVNKNAGIVAVQ